MMDSDGGYMMDDRCARNALIPEANPSPCGIQLMRSTAAVAAEFKTWMLLGSRSCLRW